MYLKLWPGLHGAKTRKPWFDHEPVFTQDDATLVLMML